MRARLRSRTGVGEVVRLAVTGDMPSDDTGRRAIGGSDLRDGLAVRIPTVPVGDLGVGAGQAAVSENMATRSPQTSRPAAARHCTYST